MLTLFGVTGVMAWRENDIEFRTAIAIFEYLLRCGENAGLHGGALQVESKAGEGLTFLFGFP